MTAIMKCSLCPHQCKLKEGQVGLCRVRTHESGKIVSLNYGEVAAWHLDPVEKKPLYHFFPGTWIFSAGAYGCNLHCFFCQNHEISQKYNKGEKVTPELLARLAQRDNSIGICFTYSEPLVWYEMIAETAPLVKKQGGKVVLVSNGVIEEKYLETLIPFIDAVNIDIKAFTEEFYQRYTGGKLKWVLNTVEKLAGKVHTEVTTLVIPGLNDSSAEIKKTAGWLAGLKAPVAWHLSRYYPMYKSKIPTTNENSLKDLWELARNYLPYVYIGNMSCGNTTFCPGCGAEVISRDRVTAMKTKDGKCLKCGREIWGQGLS